MARRLGGLGMKAVRMRCIPFQQVPGVTAIFQVDGLTAKGTELPGTRAGGRRCTSGVSTLACRALLNDRNHSTMAMGTGEGRALLGKHNVYQATNVAGIGCQVHSARVHLPDLLPLLTPVTH